MEKFEIKCSLVVCDYLEANPHGDRFDLSCHEGGDCSTVRLNRETAAQLRDYLTLWLERPVVTGDTVMVDGEVVWSAIYGVCDSDGRCRPGTTCTQALEYAKLWAEVQK